MGVWDSDRGTDVSTRFEFEFPILRSRILSYVHCTHHKPTSTFFLWIFGAATMSNYMVAFPDRSRVDICTEEGANELLLKTPSSAFDLFSSRVQKIAVIRKKNERRKKIKEADQTKLMKLYDFFGYLGSNSDREIFRQAVPEPEIQRWLANVIDDIKMLYGDENWTRERKMAQHIFPVLDHCTYMLRHSGPLSLAFESDFFQALACFVKARRGDGDLPPLEVCQSITQLFYQVFETDKYFFDNTRGTEKTFKKLESCGLLEEFLRCLVAVRPESNFAAGIHDVIAWLGVCPRLLKRKFKRDDPCGKVLWAIVEGSAENRCNDRDIAIWLGGIAKAIKFREDSGKIDGCDNDNCFKHNPSEFCSKCKTSYCSKECQKADWARHKTMCSQKTQWQSKAYSVAKHDVNIFMRKNFELVALKMAIACKTTGLGVSDMIVELNFMMDRNGIIPAMEEQPIFKIAPIRDYIEGGRPGKPDWETMNEKMYRGFASVLEDRSMPENCWKFLCNSAVVTAFHGRLTGWMVEIFENL
mmetsp:Transcript_6012/g.14237  ORF Transcript_6012/g.14237 Transcript_6012/m.14237 type:complete len:527 (-) Transcript_6012:127-1707(-)